LEVADLTSGLRVEQNGALRPFLTDYLFTEVLFAIQDQKNLYIDAREVTNTVIQQLLKSPNSPIFTPKEISKTTAEVLKRFDNRSWHRYAAEHPSVTS
jgi:transcriptional regulator NrdR family protein